MLKETADETTPLQKELGSLTKVLGLIAWTAVAFIVVMAWARGMELSQILLLGTAMAISAIPTGMPAFVSALLSHGARQLADAKAVLLFHHDPTRHDEAVDEMLVRARGLAEGTGIDEVLAAAEGLVVSFG